jgi:LacI family transcriptional regulator
MGSTIKDVAKKAGVSPTTVSLVFNNRQSRVSPTTRERVMAAAKELNYYPNHFAASLVTKRSHIIGVVSDSVNIFSAQVVAGIVRQAKLQGYQVIQVSASQENGDDLEYLNIFLNQGIDGVIFPHSSISSLNNLKNGFQAVIRSGIPAIAMDVEIDGAASCADGCDHIYGGYLATRHLLEYGHRKIGVISGPKDYVSSVKRLDGYRKALDQAGIPFDPSLVYVGNYKLESGQDALPYLLGKGVTAIFAFNDMIALGIYKAIRNYGMSIPKDISVVGYDDIFISDVLEVPLTTVRIPIEDIGRHAARELIELIECKRSAADLPKYEPVLMVRASTRRLES